MKKKLMMVLALILITFSTGILAACDQKNVEKSYIKAGTIANTVVMGGTVETKDAVFVIQYKNGKTKEIAAKDLTFSQIDTLEAGTKTMTITYKKLTATFLIEVVESEITVASAYALESKLLQNFEANKAARPGEKKIEYIDREEPLYVGTDNVFNFGISATGIDQNGNLAQQIARIRTTITVEVKAKNASTFTLLEGDDLDEMVAIDTTYVTLKFTPEAAGNVFKVTVSALETADGYDVSGTSFEAELTVIEGYNVYTARQLSIINNSNTIYDWQDFKAQFDLEDVVANTIILQNEIKVTKDDIPASMLWKQGDANFATAQALTEHELAGSLKDSYSCGIYNRVVENGSEFNLIGNYFSLNLEEMPKILVEGNLERGIKGANLITTHLPLIFMHADSSAVMEEETSSNWKNVRFIGNSTKNDDPLNSGGLIQSKHNKVNFNAYNTISTNFYITYFLEMGEKDNDLNGNFVLDKTKGYDSYNTLFFIWGAKNVLIKNSDFVNAGGPAMIINHCNPNETGGGNPSYINVVASNIESVVNGKEPWFNTYGAGGMLGEMLGLDGFFANTGKTIIGRDEGPDNKFLNVIAAYIPSGTSIAKQKIKGYIRMFDTEADFNNYYENSQLTTFGLDVDGTLARKAYDSNLTYIESSKTGGYINSSFGTATPNGDTSFNPLTGEGVPYFTGNYLNIYTHLGIGAMVKIYDKQA